MVSEEIKAPTVSPIVSNWLTVIWILTPVWSAPIYGYLLAGINQILFSQSGSRLYSLVSIEQLMVAWFCLMGIFWLIVLLRHQRSIHFFLPVFWFVLVYASSSVGIRLESTFQVCAGRSIKSFEHRF